MPSKGNPKIKDFGFKKGDKRAGRPPGSPNKSSKALKDAIINAAGLSKHSETHDLEGYMLFLADDRPAIFAGLLGRLIPVQAKVTNDGQGPVHLHLDLNMSLQDMVNNFEQRIKAAYVPQANTPQLAPPIIEQDPVDA